MTKIVLTTFINCPAEQCFDLARSADVHLESTKHTHEKVIAGRTSGLFELNDEVTWEAIHLGFRQKLSTRITRFERPVFFEDQMLKGAFKSMRHEHHFKEEKTGTMMKDIFEYEVPVGWLGKLFDHLYLKRYMTRLLVLRNQTIKSIAEHPEHNNNNKSK